MNTCHTGSLAVRHSEVHAEAPRNGFREHNHGIMAMPLYNLSMVLKTQVRGHLKGGPQRSGVNVIRHFDNT